MSAFLSVWRNLRTAPITQIEYGPGIWWIPLSHSWNTNFFYCAEHFENQGIVKKATACRFSVRTFPSATGLQASLSRQHDVSLLAKACRSKGARIILGGAVFAAAAVGQVSRLENQRISDIQLLPPQALDAKDLAKAVPLKKGDALRAEDIAGAIDNLFATGRFADVVVEGERSGEGVIVRFVTQPVWFVGGVAVEGKISTPPNRAQVVATTRLSLGAPFHEEDLTQAANAVKKALADNGLYEAEVTPQLERDENTQQIFITIKLDEHKRAKYEVPVIRAGSNAESVAAAQASAERAVAPNAPTAEETAGVDNDTKLSDSTIIHATGWRVPIIHWWRQVTDERTRRGVQDVVRKYEKKDRLSARVDLDKLDYDPEHRRVRPNLIVSPGPKIEVKAVEAKISHGALKKNVPVYQEHAVNNDLLAEGKRNLSDYFQSKGYYDVDVDIRSAPPANDRETIEYVISEGTRYKLTHLSFKGNHYFSDDVLRERMFMHPASFLVMRHGRYSEAFRRKDEENITNLYRSNGFRDVTVHSIVDRNYQGKVGQVGVTVEVDEGAQWIVDKLSLNGMNQIRPEEVAGQLASVSGEPFSEANLAMDRTTILTYYYERGFPGANFQAAWAPSGSPHHVNVTYTITEGDRKYVRKVLTSGLRITRPRLVDKLITLNPGDPLSPIAQTDIQKRFYDLGIFARVDTALQDPDGDTDEKYILYNFEEANRYILSLGAGTQVARFGTPSSTNLNNPGGATGISPQVSVDLTRLNFRGVGQSIAFHGLLSTLEKRGSINYLIPRFLDSPKRDLTFTLLYDDSLNVRTFASHREEGSVQLSQTFSKSISGSLLLDYRRVSVSSVVIPVLLIPGLLQPVRIGMISANFTQDRRDDKADAHHGIYNTADLGVAGKFFGSQRSFGRILLRNATYHRLPRNMVLARQTQFGVIAPFAAPAGLSDQESVPLPERFFGGGADSLRAFPYNQAGPRDTGMSLIPGSPSSQPTGFPLGGNALFFNNVELRFPFLGPNIQGVFFHDMGNVFSSVGNISFRFSQKSLQDFDYTVHAAGFGIRYRTPVGPIRLDLAYSINPPSFIGFSGTPQQLLQCNPNLPPQGPCVGVKQSISHFQFFFSIGQTF
jgi:outer membrane protein insertion porin family